MIHNSFKLKFYTLIPVSIYLVYLHFQVTISNISYISFSLGNYKELQIYFYPNFLTFHTDVCLLYMLLFFLSFNTYILESSTSVNRDHPYSLFLYSCLLVLFHCMNIQWFNYNYTISSHFTFFFFFY